MLKVYNEDEDNDKNDKRTNLIRKAQLSFWIRLVDNVNITNQHIYSRHQYLIVCKIKKK